MSSLDESIKKDEQMKKLAKVVLAVVACLLLVLLVIYPFIYSVFVLKESYHPVHSIKQGLTLNGKLFKSKAEKDREIWLAKTENYVKRIFTKIELKKQSADGVGVYNFYINPQIWSQLTKEQKDVIYQKCMMYVYLRINPKDKCVPKKCTKIISLTDGEVLAECVKCVPTYK
ncbi:MAG: hypothetical protein K6E29_03090 [Cyanobacteria bacterium RUI128]|nr:hypothetical protein [Cyanobacteria bacterium RUI128]